MSRLVNWVEIPVIDQERAQAFYSAVLGVEFHEMSIGDVRYAIFPSQDGALATGEGYKPSPSGPLVYLNGGEDLAVPLGRVTRAGGRILLEKTFLSKEAGHIGIFVDTEGNKLAMHSMS